MRWRAPCLVRAVLAPGLVVAASSSFTGPTASAQSPAAVPSASRAIDVEPSAPPVDTGARTLDLLEGRQSGDLTVVAHGHGSDGARLTIRNAGARRLNVVVPPGLVAASKAAQGRGGGAGALGGGGMQSIGLGAITNRPGAFGEFVGDAGGGLRSIAPAAAAPAASIAVPPGEAVDVTLPGVCLNYGKPAPTGRDTLALMTVEEYTTDARVRKALRSLATLGTSHGVAQAVMWRVCNDLPFEAMMERAGGKVMNAPEIALAARFVAALDETEESDLVAPALLSRSRVYVQVEGARSLAADARRLQGELDGLRVLGLPLHAGPADATSEAVAPALALRVVLTETKIGETKGRIIVRASAAPNVWRPFGQLAFRDNSSLSVLDGKALSKALDRALAGAFVTVKPARRAVGSTTLKVENRLPFTIVGLVVRVGDSSGSPSVPFSSVGVGPARSALLPIQAPRASLVEHVELNGL